MKSAIVIIYSVMLFLLIWAFIKDRNKTRQALLIAVKSFIRILPMMLIIVVFIGLLMGFVSQNAVSKIVGEQADFLGILVSALSGAVMQVPSLISFPLGASLLKSGASVSSVAVFLTTLTMIGFVTLPLEIRELGKKTAFLRNGISFIIAVVIGLIMGAVL